MQKWLIVLLTVISTAVWGTTYYIDYVSGSDSNDGLVKVTGGGHGPWKHAPGMHGTSGNVLAYETAHSSPSSTSNAGDCFIFKGGVTWPNDCFVWQWQWGCGTGWAIGVNAIYFGVDTTWHSPGSWSRPIFDAQGSLVTDFTKGSPPVTQTMFRAYGGTGGYFIIDNFEFKGLYVLNNQNQGEFFMINVAANIAEVKNCYIHGWGHGPVVNAGPCNNYGDGRTYTICNRFTSGSDSGKNCIGQVRAIGTPFGDENVDIKVHHCYIDGSDSYPIPGDIGAAIKGFGKHFYNNYVTYTQNILTANFWDYVWGNTFIDNIRVVDVNPSNHHNGYQSYGGTGKKSYVYNNFIKDISGGATFIWYPKNTTKFYAFNNVICGDSNQTFQLGNTDLTSNSNTAGFYIWNNTMQSVNMHNWPIISASPSGYIFSVLFVKNNHLIAPSKTINAGVNASNQTTAANIFQTNSEAIALNYTSGSTYPLFPPTESSLTVGAGTDLSYLRDSLIDSDPSHPSTACLYDAALGVSINTTDHTVSYPNRTPVLRGSTRDIGAYQYTKNGMGKTIPHSAHRILHSLLPNPIKAGLLRQYLREKQGSSVYDLEGHPVKIELLSSMGLYLVQDGTNAIQHKVMIIK